MKCFSVIFVLLSLGCTVEGKEGWEVNENPTVPTPSNTENSVETETENNSEEEVELEIEPPFEPPREVEASNESCENRLPLIPGERILQTFDGSPFEPGCLGFETRKRYFEAEIPPGHVAWFGTNGVARMGESCDSTCGWDPVNFSNESRTVTYVVEENDLSPNEIQVVYEAVPIPAHSRCQDRVYLYPGEEHVFDMRGGHTTYSPCQIVEAHNAFFYQLRFGDHQEVEVSVDPVDPDWQIRPSIQVIDDLISVYYPQCSMSENDVCHAKFDSYFEAGEPARLILQRPDSPDAEAGFLLVVNAGWYPDPSRHDHRIQIRIKAL